MYRSVRYRHRDGDIIEVQEYHDGNHGAPGQPRQKKREITPEDIERINQWNRERLCWRKLVNHFGKDDYFVTLTYRPEERPPEMEAAKRDWKQFCTKLRRRYKKAGMEMLWIRNIEVGTKNGWHIHCVLKRIPDLDIFLSECWEKGRVVIKLIYQQGNMKDLAAYLTKTPKTEKRIRESHYWTSRNLPIPEPEKKLIRGWKLEDKPRVPRGYYLEKESLREGINPFGFRYRTYILVRIKDPRRRKPGGQGCHTG